MAIPVNNVTRFQRRDLLAKVEAFAAEFLTDLERRKADRDGFWCYMNFCTPMVMDLIAWERIHAVDLQVMPSVKRLFVDAANAAHSSVYNYGRRDPEMDRGNGRRTFNEISEAELAANILPKLEHILHCWGISHDPSGAGFSERELTEQEVEQLTRYYGDA
jgi:hypothetical protein